MGKRTLLQCPFFDFSTTEAMLAHTLKKVDFYE